MRLAGIVADSNPEAEYEETLAKAAGFLAALSSSRRKEALTDNPKSKINQTLVISAPANNSKLKI